MNDLVEAFEAMLQDEPSLPDIADHAMAAGEQLRRRRRLAAVAVIVGVTAAVVVPLAIWRASGSTQTVTPVATVTVPEAVANNYPAQASAALCAAGLRPVYVSAPVIQQADQNTNGYSVRSTNPAPGARVPAGSVVDLTLVESDNGGGPWPKGTFAVVPKVTGLDVNRALPAITVFGLRVNVTTTTPTGALLVTAQSPAPGTSVPPGATVTLRVGQSGSDGCPTPR